jgi:hypothetical protein
MTYVWEENTVYASLIAFGSQSVCSDIYIPEEVKTVSAGEGEGVRG